MLLHTPRYFLFFLVVFFFYWLIPGKQPRKILLLIASYVFYFTFDVWFAILLFGLTVGTFLIGRALHQRPNARLLMWSGVGLNLGVLSIFKLSNFFLSSLSDLLTSLGVHSSLSAVQLLLPIGISFYTFQGISYIVEIYRGKLQPAASFLDFMLYLAFFPKLIAGPFVRPGQFLEQIAQPVSRINAQTFKQGAGLLILGLFKKIVIADSLASLSHTAFQAASLSGNDFPTPLFLQGFYLYAFEIYADFSGYTDLARASAMLLGFSLPENFRQPYLSGTISNFWNGWHMTLTQWFREYLFFPITRGLLTRTNRQYQQAVQISANLITMALIGIWHGAAWTFLIWGLWHGLLLSLERIFNIKPNRPWQVIGYGILSFHLIGIGWVFFAANSFSTAINYLVGLFSFSQMAWLGIYSWPVLFAGVLTFGIDLTASGKFPAGSRIAKQFQPILVTAALVVIFGLLLLSAARGGDTRPFIYGQF